MNKESYIFTQLCQFLPRDYFEYLVRKYQGNHYVKSFSCWNHCLVILWAQLTSRESLRDIIGSLDAHKQKFHHLGFGKSVCRSTLSQANEKREIRIFQLFAEKMVKLAQDKRVNIENLFMEGIDYRVFAVDSTSLILNPEQFWWTELQKGTGGIKMHTLFDILTSIPVCNIVTDHSVRDQSVMDSFEYEPDAFYVFDKAYVKLVSLSRIDSLGGFFIVRRKKKMRYEILESYPCEAKDSGVLMDLKIALSNRWAKSLYKTPLRIVYYYSKEKNRVFEFFTNNFDLDAGKIAYLYKCRWQIELFFKWIKQHLKIKRFYGFSENAVKIQIYVSIIAYCLVAIVATELKTKLSPFELLRVLSVSLFEKANLRDFINGIDKNDNLQIDSYEMLKLF